MFCNISNQVPEHPVVSKKSGLLFEKRLITQYISDFGQCPVTKEFLSQDDLLDVKTEKLTKPRNLTTNSIPQLLNVFASEWDEIVLECFQQKQYITTLRQELSNAMYENDAATRVIARLMKEKEELKGQLTQVQQKVDAMEEEAPKNPQFPIEVVKHFETVAKTLSTKRKGREISKILATANSLSSYSCVGSHPLHKAKPAGISSLCVHSSKNLILTGGMDHNVILFNKDTEKILSTLTGHKKEISSLFFNNDLIVTSSYDKTTKIWNFDKKSGDYLNAHTIKHHKDLVVGSSLHPGGSFFTTFSSDMSWACFNMEGELVLSMPGEHAYTTGTYHPDGLILATAIDDFSIPLWDLSSNDVVAEFKNHTDVVTSLSFSENGYYLASGSKDGTVRIWDLRKQANLHTFEIEAPVQSVQWDYSGNYLAVGADDVHVYQKNFEKIVTFSEHTKAITGVGFGKDAEYLVSASLDRNLKFYSSSK